MRRKWVGWVLGAVVVALGGGVVWMAAPRPTPLPLHFWTRAGDASPMPVFRSPRDSEPTALVALAKVKSPEVRVLPAQPSSGWRTSVELLLDRVRDLLRMPMPRFPQMFAEPWPARADAADGWREWGATTLRGEAYATRPLDARVVGRWTPDRGRMPTWDLRPDGRALGLSERLGWEHRWLCADGILLIGSAQVDRARWNSSSATCETYVLSADGRTARAKDGTLWTKAE